MFGDILPVRREQQVYQVFIYLMKIPNVNLGKDDMNRIVDREIIE